MSYEEVLKEHFSNEIKRVSNTKLKKIEGLDPLVYDKLIKMKKEYNKAKKANKQTKKFTIAETFVGCGGSHFGFKRAGFESIFVNDCWNDAIDTIKLNDKDLSHDKIFLEDIKKLDEEFFINNNINPSECNTDILLGGVVCKGFSLAGVRNPYDERNYLYLEQLRLVNMFRPKVSIIENVPGIISMKILKRNQSEELKLMCEKVDKIIQEFKSQRAQLIGLKKQEVDESLIIEKNDLIAKISDERKILEKELEGNMYSVIDDIENKYIELGYKVYKKVLMCSNYECATNRKRLFIVAVRNDIEKEWTYPESVSENNKPTVKDALDLLDLNGINDPKKDPMNVPMNHRPKTIEKFKQITCDKKAGTFFSRGSSQRLDYNKPAPTLVPGHSSFQLHPTEHRSITVREGAIISGFPKDFQFAGVHGHQCMQIGNAIPVNMAYHLAEHCKKFLSSI